MRYCETCDKPYCKDCGQEWNQYRWVYNNSGITWTYTGTGSTAGMTTSVDPVLTTSTAYCVHGDN